MPTDQAPVGTYQLRHRGDLDVCEDHEHHADRTVRDGHGHDARSSGTARRDVEAAELRTQGLSYQDIADAMVDAGK
ncbi:hypothetical protein [Streptomyces sp. LN785]|uniref:hypothetical protein n=1 Tax=Streptomyces sp. LN785 TaxID=3112983 RepID=UPI00371D7886